MIFYLEKDMTSNILKLIACVSMLIDHAGYLLFPEQEWMRWVGRLAMPIFAFFIAEGCIHTSNRLRYFVRLFVLGIICQSVYVAEEILSGGVRSVYLNILFTLSFAAVICFTFIDFKKALENVDKKAIFLSGALFVLSFVSVLAFDIFCTHSEKLVGISVTFDYGFVGAVLPLFAVIFTTRRLQWIAYSIGLVFFVQSNLSELWYVCFALLDIPILAFYNGERGKYNTKYLFYLFYPLHLAALYGIDILMNN